MRISEAVLEFSALVSVSYLGRNPRNLVFLSWGNGFSFYTSIEISKISPSFKDISWIHLQANFFLQIFLICLLVYLYAMMMSLNHGNSFAYNKWCLFGQDGTLFLLLMDLFELWYNTICIFVWRRIWMQVYEVACASWVCYMIALISSYQQFVIYCLWVVDSHWAIDSPS